MTLRRIEDPSDLPLTLAEAKAHLRVDLVDQNDDALITRLISAATRIAENYTGRPFISQTWEKAIDAFPDKGGAIELEKPPVQSVVQLKYIDINGQEQALNPDALELDAQSETAWLVPAYGYVWPVTLDKINAVKVQFICGYGNADAVPDDIKAAMLLLIGHLYENREAVIVDARVQAFELPLGVQMLLEPYRLLRFA